MYFYFRIKNLAGFVLAEIVTLAIHFLFSPFFLIGLLVYGVLTGQIGR